MRALWSALFLSLATPAMAIDCPWDGQGIEAYASWSALLMIGQPDTPVAAAGAGYFKNQLVTDLVTESDSRSGGITGSN